MAEVAIEQLDRALAETRARRAPAPSDELDERQYRAACLAEGCAVEYRPGRIVGRR